MTIGRLRHFAALISIGFAITPEAGYAASSKDIDRLTTFAVVLGRAIGCGLPVSESAARDLGKWMDRRFPRGSSDQKTYMPVFMIGVQHNAEEQRAGRSPDTCASVTRFFESEEFRSAVRP